MLTWEGRRVLITGACGFVGANLTKMLMDCRATVIGLDRATSSPSLRALCGQGHPPVVVGDVTDLNDMLSLVDQVRPDVIYHLAGQGHIKDSQEAPWPAFHVNVMGTVAMLEAVRRVKPDTVVVVASSNEVYPAGGPWREEQTPEPRTLYGWSKATQDAVARAYGRMFSLRVACLRHTNAVGPANPHNSHLVQAVIGALLQRRPVLLRSDGTPRKMYLAIKDVCRAYLLLAEGLISGMVLPGTAWNAGSIGIPPSVREIVERLIVLAGAGTVEIICGLGDAESGYEQTLDCSRLRALGWTESGIDEALRHAYEWYYAFGFDEWLRREL